ncbi:unnamed protein product, partial [Durusdinium trenchii]
LFGTLQPELLLPSSNRISAEECCEPTSLIAWHVCRACSAREEQQRLQSKVLVDPPAPCVLQREAGAADPEAASDAQLSEMAGMREVVESLGSSLDSKVCVWKTKGNDLLNGIIGHGSGTLKIRQVEGTVPLPTCGEELQHGHRLTGMSWLVLRTMSSDILEAYGFVLGRRANCAISGYFANEYEIRKKAYHLVRDGVGRPPAHELALFASGQLASSPLQTKGKGVRKHALKPKTMGGKRVCFKFTNGGKCADS